MRIARLHASNSFCANSINSMQLEEYSKERDRESSADEQDWMSQKSYESEGSFGGRRENDPQQMQMKFKRQSQFARIDLNRKFDRIKKKSLLFSQRNINEDPDSANMLSNRNLYPDRPMQERVFKSNTIKSRDASPDFLRQNS